VLKNQLIRLRTLGEEAFGATSLPTKNSFHDDSNATPCFAACSVKHRLVRIGGMKLVWVLGTQDIVRRNHTCQPSRARANSATGTYSNAANE